MGDSAATKQKKAADAAASAANQQAQLKASQTNSNLVDQNAFQPSPLNQQLTNFNTSLQNSYSGAVKQNTADYTQGMGDYSNLIGKLGSQPATSFNFTPTTWDNVNYTPPPELGQSYGDLNSAASTYQGFADTGGYSPQDIQELRARGMSPITASYAATREGLDRSRAIGGAGGSPNYIAALSKAQRELPGQVADAETGVNASLADAIRQGKLSGASGLASVGGTEGGLAENEANALLQAAITNSQGSLSSQTTNSNGALNAQGMTQSAKEAQISELLAAMSGRNSLYGTTPGLTSLFGNQLLNNQGQQLTDQGQTNQLGLGLLGSNQNSYSQPGAQYTDPKTTPAWQTLLGAAGTIGSLYKPSPKPTTSTATTPATTTTPAKSSGGNGILHDLNPLNWFKSNPGIPPGAVGGQGGGSAGAGGVNTSVSGLSAQDIANLNLGIPPSSAPSGTSGGMLTTVNGVLGYWGNDGQFHPSNGGGAR